MNEFWKVRLVWLACVIYIVAFYWTLNWLIGGRLWDLLVAALG